MSIIAQVSLNLRNWLMLPGAWLPKQRDTVYTAPIRWAQTSCVTSRCFSTHWETKDICFTSSSTCFSFLSASHTLRTSSLVPVSHHSISFLWVRFVVEWSGFLQHGRQNRYYIRYFYFYVHSVNLVLLHTEQHGKQRKFCRWFRIQI